MAGRWLAVAAALAGCGGNDGTSVTPGDLSDANLVNAAVVLASCIPDDPPTHHLNDRYYRRRDTAFALIDLANDCVATAGTGCAAVRTCLSLTVTSDPTSPFTASCDGDIAVSTGDGLRFEWNCAALGRQCQEGLCVEELRETCSTPFQNRCEADQPVTCGEDGFVEYGPECGSLQLTCSDEAFGVCVGDGPACSLGDSGNEEVSFAVGVSCSGDVLTACVNRTEADIACSDLDPRFTCQEVDLLSFCGLASECLPSDEQRPTCNGDLLEFCDAGRIAAVDCTELGFSGCTQEGTFAFCGTVADNF